jgi:hypothetical protein
MHLRAHVSEFARPRNQTGGRSYLQKNILVVLGGLLVHIFFSYEVIERGSGVWFWKMSEGVELEFTFRWWGAMSTRRKLGVYSRPHDLPGRKCHPDGKMAVELGCCCPI